MSLPLSLKGYLQAFDSIYLNIQQIYPRLGCHLNKVNLIQDQLQRFRVALYDRPNPEITIKQSKRIHRFLKLCTIYFGFLTRYHCKVWLKYFLETPINSTLNDLHKLWYKWLHIAEKFSINAFENPQILYYSHYLDLKSLRQVLEQNMNSFSQSSQEILRKRINSINEAVNPNDPHFESDSSYILHHNEVTPGVQIGSGGFSIVYRAYWGRIDSNIALKELNSTSLTKRDLESLRRELSALSSFEHPNILKFYGLTIEPPFYIATELMPNMTLFHLLRAQKAIEPILLTKIATGVARGLEYIHAMGYVHRDIKTANIFLNENYEAVIADFGLSRVAGENMTLEIGTMGYMAPEVIRFIGVDYTSAVDVYAFGIMLWEMLAIQQPLEGLSLLQAAYMIVNDAYRPDIPIDAPENLKRLIRKCWSQDPTKRPLMHQVRRLLESGKVTFEGTDIEEFKHWVDETKGPHLDIVKKAMDEHGAALLSTLGTLKSLVATKTLTLN